MITAEAMLPLTPVSTSKNFNVVLNKTVFGQTACAVVFILFTGTFHVQIEVKVLIMLTFLIQ